MNKKYAWMSVILFVLVAIPTLAATATQTTSDSSSSSMQGQLTWTQGVVSIRDMQTYSTPLDLGLDKAQKNNVNARTNELVVRLAEEFFKADVLRQVLLQKMYLATPLSALFLNGNWILLDAAGEVYNPNHIQISKNFVSCSTGSICLIGRMYSSTGQIIQRQQIVIFPSGGGNIVAGGGLEQ